MRSWRLIDLRPVQSTTLIALALLASTIAGCSVAEPQDDPPPPPAELELFEGTRTVAFERIAALRNLPVLDMDVDVGGVSAAVVSDGGATELWMHSGDGWREVFADGDFAPLSVAPTAVCIRPGGDRVFVGGTNGRWWMLDGEGTVLTGPARYNLRVDQDDFDTDWPTAQCRWAQTSDPNKSGFLMASFTNAFGTDGTLLWVDGDRLSTQEWEHVRDGFQRQTATSVTRVPTAYSGLDVVRNEGYNVRAGIQYGPSSANTTEHTIENLFIYQDWQYDAWLIRDENPAVAVYGQPRVFGRHPSGGEAILFREPGTNQWAALVAPPEGYREPLGMLGMAVLDAPSLSRTGLYALDIDSDGHLWVGGRGGIGLQRSTTPVR